MIRKTVSVLWILTAIGLCQAKPTLAADNAPRNEVVIAKLQGGTFECKTPHYRMVIGNDGNIWNLAAGGIELLVGSTNAQAGARLECNGKTLVLANVRQDNPDTIVCESESAVSATNGLPPASSGSAKITYLFRPEQVEMTFEQTLGAVNLRWLPSDSVTASHDSRGDFSIQMADRFPYGQLNPRWTTRQGPMLSFEISRYQKEFTNVTWDNGTMLMPLYKGANPIMIRPMDHPVAASALIFEIKAASKDFLLPGNEPIHFDINVRNAGVDPQNATVHFQIRDYLTRTVIAEKPTAVKLARNESLTLATDLPLKDPGPYLGGIVVEQDGKVVRDFDFLFTYDFPNYRPATTRPPDFKQFWKEALAESQKLPLDIKMTPVPEKGTELVEAFKISYATLNGRRIYGWYARPKAAGKHPASIQFPSSGIYPLRGPNISNTRCTLWIQIHGFDVDLSNRTPNDPGSIYWWAGIESARTSMWRTIYVSLVRAVDFMAAQAEVDPEQISVGGGSQGGGLALVAAALDHRIKSCNAGYFGLARLDWTVKYNTGYWPFDMSRKPANQTEEEFLKTLSYFDVANFTEDIQCRVGATIGLLDRVTAAGNAICSLAHVKKNLLYMVCLPDAGHGSPGHPRYYK